MRNHRQWCDLLRGERLPAAVVDLAAFDRNAAQLEQVARRHGKTLRLATKSIRVPALVGRVLQRGAPWRGLLCFAVEEAAALAGDGFDDLLVAYPTVLPGDLTALRRLHEAGRDVKLVVDGAAGVAALATAMAGVARPFPVVPDIDAALRLAGGRVHLGVRRSPLRSEADVEALLDEIGRHPQLTVGGAMMYEAQVAGLPDNNPFRRATNLVMGQVRKRSVSSVAARRERLAALLARRGVALPLFNGGGTGSIDWSAREAALTEVAAGSGLLCPHLFDYYSNLHLEPACWFALQISRASDPDHVTCLGGGYIASGDGGADRLPLPVSPPGLSLLGGEGAGEVQTPLKLPPGVELAVGEPVLFRHAKAGELAERFTSYLLVDGDQIVDRVPTYRGRGWCFF